MNVLALDTCFPALSVAVGVGLGTPAANVVSRTEPMATGHAERMMPLLNDVLAEAGTSIGNIDRIAVTVGPGSFTGTRIGIAAARALKLAIEIPIVPYTSLQAIAFSPLIDMGPEEDLAVVIDAHRGEAYVQIFDGATRDPVSDPRIVSLTDLASIVRSRPLLAVGTAADAAAVAINAAGSAARSQPGMIFPDMAAAAARAASARPSARPVEPLYLRPPDAKPQEGKSLERAGA
jgi:tRNA threonylcarbamoyladenosine biosynthesis protein TsaB